MGVDANGRDTAFDDAGPDAAEAQGLGAADTPAAPAPDSREAARAAARAKTIKETPDD